MTLEIYIEDYNNQGSNVISLDMPDETVWSWENFLASDGLRDAWSTDIEIPKTVANMKALGIGGVLDNQSRTVSHGILHVMSRSVDVDVVLVSLNPETMTVSLFEHILPIEILGKNLKDFFTDSWDSLYQWNRYSNTMEPGTFQRYDYGMPQKYDAAMYHPCRQLNHLIAGVNQSAGCNLPYGEWSWYAVATGKRVCPQNARQVIEVYRDGDELTMRGSQHVLNDLSWSNTSEIVFNRGCRAHVTAWISYDKKGATTNNFHLMAAYDFNNDVTNTPTQARAITIPSATWANGCFKEEWDWNLTSGDGVLTIYMVPEGTGNPLDRYNLLEALFIIDYSNYDPEEYTDTDELEYIARRPGMHIASKNGTYWINGQQNVYDGSNYNSEDLDHDYRFCEWDGSTIQIFRNQTGHPSTLYPLNIPTTQETFAWFGYFVNLPDISIRDLVYAMGWLQGKKAVWENGEVVFKELEHLSIEGMTTKIEMNNTLARKNFLKLEGGNIDISEIDNDRLELEKAWYSCPLTYVERVNAIVGRIHQYSNLKMIDDAMEPHDQMWECDYDQPEGFCIMNTNSTYHFLGRIDFLYNLDGALGWLKYMKPVKATIRQEVETMPDRLDFISIDGRDFLVLSGEVNEGVVEYEGLLLYLDDNASIDPPGEVESQDSEEHEGDGDDWDPTRPDDYDPDDEPDWPDYEDDHDYYDDHDPD